MSYQIQWGNTEKTVVQVSYTMPATNDDLRQMARDAAMLLSSVPHTVHMIIDERKVNFALSSSDMFYLEKLVAENQGQVVVVVTDQQRDYKVRMQRVGQKFAPRAFDEVQFVESVEAARDYLAETFGVTFNRESAT